MSNDWQYELKIMLLIFVSLWVMGWWTEHIQSLLLLGSGGYILRHLYYLHQLNRWLICSRKRNALPDTWGAWGEVFYELDRLQQRHRKRKRRLTELLDQFHRSTDALPDSAVVLGTKNEIEWFNRSAITLLGLHPTQDKGQFIGNLIRYPSFNSYLAHPEEQKSIKMVSPANPNIILRVHIVSYGENERLLLARDVTEIHRLEQVRQDFVANVSHELRTPLTVIAGFLETMIDAEDHCSKQWARGLSLMAQQTVRMRNIVDDLLLLSRLESEPVEETYRSVEVAELLTNIVEEARLLSNDQHHIQLNADPSVNILGRADELRSAFSNIIFNAVRYTPAGGDITVRWYVDEHGGHVEICDSGEGIAPEHLPRLTERFYRVDVGRSRNQGGTGLGLAIVKHVLNRHQAHLYITSELGKGSMFRCDFPPQSLHSGNLDL
jgi:two-component system, OmpR family, phosphate regulon sensor histidine kinase PhoR